MVQNEIKLWLAMCRCIVIACNFLHGAMDHTMECSEMPTTLAEWHGLPRRTLFSVLLV